MCSITVGGFTTLLYMGCRSLLDASACDIMNICFVYGKRLATVRRPSLRRSHAASPRGSSLACATSLHRHVFFVGPTLSLPFSIFLLPYPLPPSRHSPPLIPSLFLLFLHGSLLLTTGLHWY
ncbi:hypothetical protein VPH35_007744 [Triticum aestivum]